jgi:hypothetical protein
MLHCGLAGAPHSSRGAWHVHDTLPDVISKALRRALDRVLLLMSRQPLSLAPPNIAPLSTCRPGPEMGGCAP